MTPRVRIAALLLALGLAGCSTADRSASTCPVPAVVIDVGHTADAPGATAASGAPEFGFNQRFAHRLADRLRARGAAAGGVSVVEITGPDPRLDRRVETIRTIAGRSARSLILSIHHDSVQARYLKTRVVDGVEQTYTDAASGFSLFVPAETPVAGASLAAAEAIADAMIDIGRRPSLHHAEPIEGENRRLLDPDRAVYAGDFLKILRTADAPAVLIEIGVIKNPVDERRLSDPGTAAALAKAIAEAVDALPCRVTERSAARTAG